MNIKLFLFYHKKFFKECQGLAENSAKGGDGRRRKPHLGPGEDFRGEGGREMRIKPNATITNTPLEKKAQK